MKSIYDFIVKPLGDKYNNKINIKDKLKELNKIAKRRSKVQDIALVSEEIKVVKKMAKMDKQRIGYKPQEGETQWTRCCQNSGDGKRRRPTQFNAESMADLLKSGYKKFSTSLSLINLKNS